MNNEFGFSDKVGILIGLLESNLHQTHELINSHERKAQSNFTVVSAVAVAVILVNVNYIDLSNLEQAGKLALFVFAVAYLLVALMSIATLWPQEMDLCPLEPTKKNIAKMLDCTDKKIFHFELMVQYSNTFNSHMCVIERKRQYVMSSYFFIVVAIFAVVIELLVYYL